MSTEPKTYKEKLVAKIENKISQTPWMQKSLEFLTSFTIVGFNKVPAWDVARFFYIEINRNLLAPRAKSIAYSFFMALFPGLILIFSLIPYIPVEGFQENLVALITSIIPDKSFFNYARKTVSDVIIEPRGGLLSLGILFVLYFTTDGVLSIIDSFNKTNKEIYNPRNFIMNRVVAFKITILLLIMFFASVILIMGGNVVLNYGLDRIEFLSDFSNILFNVLRYTVIILLMLLSYSLIYYYGPATRKKWRFFTPGSTAATIASLVTTILFSIFISEFTRYHTFYGSLATIVLLLFWMYINAIILLIGFELNASIYYNKQKMLKENENLGL